MRTFTRAALLELVLVLVLVALVHGAEHVQMNELYVSMSYEDTDGGVWRQGWPVTYDDLSWTSAEPLHVYIMLHSHTDPGWLKTFEGYYQEQTRGILTSTLNSCLQHADNRFIYAEMSFFSLWWDDATPTQREQMRKMVHARQFEIVSGAWVMNDEATVHYAAALLQYLEGHEWVRTHLGADVLPRSAWAIDPFGHSPTMPYLYALMGFNYSLIQRTHYIVKKQLARHRQLEFEWRQQWHTTHAATTVAAPFVHLMPFYSYDIPHTCGPEPAVCAQYDFSRVGNTSPWGTQVEAIGAHNVARKAAQYVDQVRKKAALYRSGNRVLVPVGDDFRYVAQEEVDAQVRHYRALMEHVNARPDEYRVHMRFATLSEYFDDVQRTAATRVGTDARWQSFFPTLQGDFFTYADVRQEYWAGYFVSRPYWKHKGRDLESYLRAAEIAFVWQRALVPHTADDAAHYTGLQYARRASSVFQHHDGMTGTARDHVVLDYGDKLHTSLGHVFRTLEHALAQLLTPRDAPALTLTVAEELGAKERVRKRAVLPLRAHARVELVLYNALVQARTEVHTLLVDTLLVEVRDAEGRSVPAQLSPHLAEGPTPLSGVYALHFVAELAPLSVRRYALHRVAAVDAKALPTRIVALRADAATLSALAPWSELGVRVERDVSTSTLALHGTTWDAELDARTGGLVRVRERASDTVHAVREDFLYYPSTHSGAYLFVPDGEAQSMFDAAHRVLAVEGALASLVVTEVAPVGHRTLALYAGARHVEVRHFTDFTRDEFLRKEFVARYVTDIASNQTLFTDLQGLQLKRSVRRPDRPVGFNYYPVTALAFVQDARTRFSVHTRQPFGAASLRDGELELLLDRRLSTDDQKGLGQGVRDNVPLEDVFHLTWERTPVPRSTANHWPFPSEASFTRSLILNHPLRALYSVAHAAPDQLLRERSLLAPDAALADARDVHLVTLRARDPAANAREAIAIVLRTHVDVSQSAVATPAAALNFAWATELSADVRVTQVQEHTLTLLHTKPTATTRLTLAPMELRSFTFSVEAHGQPRETHQEQTQQQRQEPREQQRPPERERERERAREGEREGEERVRERARVPVQRSALAALPVLPVLGIYAGVIAGLYLILRLVSRRHVVLYFAMLFILASFLQLYVFFA